MEVSYIISIVLGIATSVSAALINLAVRRQGDDLSPWSAWQGATALRLLGLLISGVVLYLYFSKNNIQKPQATITYMVLFFTITAGMILDLFISISGIQGINKTRLSK